MSETDIENGMTTSDISLLIGGVAAAIASIIYSAKHIKHSECFGGFFKCDQKVECSPDDDGSLEAGLDLDLDTVLPVLQKYMNQTSL